MKRLTMGLYLIPILGIFMLASQDSYSALSSAEARNIVGGACSSKDCATLPEDYGIAYGTSGDRYQIFDKTQAIETIITDVIEEGKPRYSDGTCGSSVYGKADAHCTGNPNSDFTYDVDLDTLKFYISTDPTRYRCIDL